MTIVGISEFTFGYAFLYEQTQNNWENLVAAPVLPNLQQEHDEGWDAHLPLNGIDFYYQFKLSDYLYRHNANYIKDGTYGGPYYRLALHKKETNRQHQRLRRLSETNPHTYYVAPEFNSTENFNAAFLEKQITHRSRMIPVIECDDINDGVQHHITFRQGDPSWIQHSERKVHEASLTGEDLPKLYRGTENEWKPVTKEFAVQLFDKTKDLVDRLLVGEKREDEAVVRPRLLDFDAGREGRGVVLRRTSEILSVVLGVTLVVVGTRN
jgi:hypothetical protein